MEWLAMTRWSPYIVGIGIGILSWFTFLLLDKPLGCSTSFTRTSGMIEKWFRGSKVNEKAYYQKFKPQIDWQWMLVIGIVVGAFISAKMSGDFHWEWVPAKWQASFGNDLWPRQLMALVGGIFMGFGSRWADGCTSGHGISGTLQLAVSGWVAAICFFIGGIAAAFVIY